MPTIKRQVDPERLREEFPNDPMECFYRHLRRASRAVSASYDHAFKPINLTAAQFTVLTTLTRAGSLSVGQLATAVGMAPSTVPRTIHPLRRDGLIQVNPGADRRERVIEVTRNGRGKVSEAMPIWQETQAKILRSIGATRWATTRENLELIGRTHDRSSGEDRGIADANKD